MIFTIILASISKNYKKKLITLMLMEAMMILNIFCSVTTQHSCSLSSSQLMIFSLMMVLDSTIGLTILVSSSRNTSTVSMNILSVS